MLLHLFPPNLDPVNAAPLTVFSSLPAGQRAQSDNEDQYGERHVPAHKDRHHQRPADNLFEGQQHEEHLCLPRGWKGEVWRLSWLV